MVVDGGHDGRTLAAKSDADAARMTTDALTRRVGNFEASGADVSHVRYALEGSRPYGLGSGAVLAPRHDLGVHHDGGDAETGTGFEVDAGIHYAAGAISIEGQVRALIADDESGYASWRASGALHMNPSL